jgi:hypothetical protein
VITPAPGWLDLYLNFGMGFHTNQAQIALLDGTVQKKADGSTFNEQIVPVRFVPLTRDAD